MDVTHTARDELVIRPVEPTDSFEDLTTLLHAAYGRLARMGLKYMATDQSVDVTRERAAQGTCLLAFQAGRLCGTILFRNADQTTGCSWYNRQDVASLAQFAVDPSAQAKGIGLRLMREVEQLARASGAAELALDTAEPATHLVNWYGRLGFRFIEHTEWSHTNYRSVILSKAL